MAIPDMISLVVCIFFIVRGMLRGAVRDIVAVTAMFAGLYLGVCYAVGLGNYLAGHTGIPSGPLSTAIAFVVIAIGVNWIGALLAALISGTVSMIKLGFLNRAFGIITGLIKSAVILYMVCSVILLFFNGTPSWFRDTVTARIYSELHSFVEPLVPDDFEDAISEKIRELRKLMDMKRGGSPSFDVNEEGNSIV